MSSTKAEVSCYRSALAQTAAVLLAGEYLPIDVLRICEKLQIPVFRDARARSPALVRRGANTEVVLPTNAPASGDTTPFERFAVAHEIGHFILATSFSALPLGRKDYWKHEQLCDAFALDLLLPASLVPGRIPGDARQLLGYVAYVARQANVPWFAAAARLTQEDQSVGLLQLRKTSTDEYKVSSSSLPDRREIGRRVAPHSRLHDTLQKLPAPSRTAFLDPQLLTEFPSFERAVSAAAVRIHDGARVAVCSSPDIGQSASPQGQPSGAGCEP